MRYRIRTVTLDPFALRSLRLYSANFAVKSFKPLRSQSKAAENAEQKIKKSDSAIVRIL
jgi:hypothetical protein